MELHEGHIALLLRADRGAIGDVQQLLVLGIVVA